MKKKIFVSGISHICGVARGFAGTRGLRLNARPITLGECAIQFIFLPQKRKTSVALAMIEPGTHCSQRTDQTNGLLIPYTRGSFHK